VVWFLVDDNLTFHKKVTTAGNAAMGCWVRAGAWSTSSLTDGFIPAQIARAIGTVSQWDKLVNAGLIECVDGGYLFHDWTHKQPSKRDIEERRERDRQRKAEQRKRENVTTDVTPPVRELPRARPHPTPPTMGGLGNATHDKPPGAATSAPGARGAPRKPDPLLEIADCDLCDDEGRKPNGMVCDHIDRRFTAAHGSKNVRETMGWKK